MLSSLPDTWDLSGLVNLWFCVGDSRAVLYSNEAVRFGSEDHKPSNLKETERIQKADGQVALGRVNGVLAVSRALGDFAFKEIKTLRPEEQKVSAEPDMTVLDRNVRF